jgi:RecB family exonuclease
LNPNIKSDQVLHFEKEVNVDIDGYKLKSIIDRCDSNNNGEVKIIDYKTGNKKYVQNIQLEVYALALSQIEQNNYELEYQFLKTSEAKRWNYTSDLYDKSKRWILNSVDEIESTDYFPPKRSRLCDYCGVSQHCN